MTLWTVARQAPESWNFPGKNTGVGCHALLQGIFLTQGGSPCLLRSGRFFTAASLGIRLRVVLYTQQRQWHPTPVLLPGKSHGQRSLVRCSPWGRKESDMTERLHFHFSLSCIGEGNGNPLQCSCLENPRNGGAWWAARHL